MKVRVLIFLLGSSIAACDGEVSGLPESDAGLQQAIDAGEEVDAGEVDAGIVEIDAGMQPIDSGIPDAGPIDAGWDYDAGTEGDGDFTIGPPYMTSIELTNQGKPHGRRFNFTMDSTQSVIFDGSDPSLNPAKPRNLTRNISVYIPTAYVNGTGAPLMVIQDGPGPIDQIAYAIDNLTVAVDPARRIPAFIAISVQNGGNDSLGSERGLEYDTMSDRYARFIELEVLPAVRNDNAIKAAYPNLKFTSDPEGRATYGCSSGAAAAFTMAWYRPDLFRRVISYSGTFVAQQNSGQPESPITPLGAWEYHSSQKLIANSPLKPVRAFLNVNENDLGSTAPESGHHNWVMANERMTDELAAKGYHRRYVLAQDLGHCASQAWQASLVDALIWLWRGYPLQPRP